MKAPEFKLSASVLASDCNRQQLESGLSPGFRGRGLLSLLLPGVLPASVAGISCVVARKVSAPGNSTGVDETSGRRSSRPRPVSPGDKHLYEYISSDRGT